MKKILLVAAAAMVVAAGCEKTKILNPVEDTIGFSSQAGKLTKAYEGDQTTLKTQGIEVWAFHATVDANNGIELGDQFDDMAGIALTCTDDTWTTVREYYWPGTEKSLDFFAISSKNKELVPTFINEGGVNDEANGKRVMTIPNYSVTASVADDDLMVADFVRQHQGQNGKQVHLGFHHALSKVMFKFTTTSTETVKVNSLTIEGLTIKGDLTVSEGAVIDGIHDNTRSEVDLAWTLGDQENDKANFTKSEVRVLTPEATSTQDDLYVTWLVLPQTISDNDNNTLTAADKRVKINYTVGTGEKAKTFDVVFELGSSTFPAWEENQAVTYTVNITPNKITFTPDVKGWEDPATNVDHTN